MTSEYLFGTGVFVLVALFAIIYLRRHEKDVKGRTPDAILNEVEVLMAYGRKKDAVELVRMAVTEFPESKELVEKLAKLG